MAYLINRNPPARLQCLHGLCKLINKKYGFNISFRMKDIKYDSTSLNIHSFCELLITNKSLGIKYCPYKKNPLNTSGCALTNGVSDDTTKSKEVSNTVNALDGLRFLKRAGNDLKLTALGQQFAETEFNSLQMLSIIQKAVLSYGMFVGMLAQIYFLNKIKFNSDEIFVGYPNSEEKIIQNGETIIISSGSEKDSNTRTKSCLLAWATTAGFVCPSQILININPKQSHIDSLSYILQKNRNLSVYSVLELPAELFSGKFITSKPLDYKNLTKNTGALRENNQQIIREMTLNVEHKIRNRRFSILYALNNAFANSTCLKINRLIAFLKKFPDEFIVDKSTFDDIIYSEIKIGFMSGIPFSIINDDCLKPLTGLNLTELSIGAPEKILNIMKTYYNN